MKNKKRKNRNSERGVALLVAMITLLLITGVAVAMIVAAGTETSISANYRSSSSAYYAALAGLEEGRGRLLPTNPNPIAPVFANVNQVQYIGNPAAGETLATILNTYPDNEYSAEFGQAPTPLASPLPSTSGANASNIPGPMYKWVRINPVTEFSLRKDVNGDSLIDNATPLFYDSGTTPPTLIVPQTAAGVIINLPTTANQVYEITSLAVLPNGTEKLLQYLVAPQTYNLGFNAPLTLAGNVGSFKGATSGPYQVNGQDGSDPTQTPVANCSIPNPPTLKDAIGVTAPSDVTTVTGGIPKNRLGNYTGLISSPDVAVTPLNSTLGSTASLDQLLTNIKSNADAVVQPYPPPTNPNFNNSGKVYNFGLSGPGYTWPADMSATNPKVIYVDGSFDLGPNTGYGLLVVTGNFHYHGNSGWKGVILVVGDGTTTFDGQGGGSGSFDGAIFVATTRDLNGNQLANFGTVNFDATGGGGNGIYYNSCWIRQANRPPTYKVLSFKEIPYTD